MEIEREEMSLAEMMKNMKAHIFAGKELNLLEFFAGIKNKSELVLAFIAVLEIVRTEAVKLVQDKNFRRNSF